MTVDTKRQLSRERSGAESTRPKDIRCSLSHSIPLESILSYAPVLSSIGRHIVFADEQIWEVDLLEFQLDRFDKLLSDEFGRLRYLFRERDRLPCCIIVKPSVHT